MPCFVCSTCGTQFIETHAAPSECPICTDDRQYVGWGGQQWTTPTALARDYAIRIADDDGIRGYDITPNFGIPQRMALVPTGEGNLLWESLSLVTDAAVADIRSRGGATAIAISHPHFYTAMVDWSEALGSIPILLHAEDRQWVQRDAPQIHFWEGKVHALSDDARLIHCGGHFAGSCVLHVDDGVDGRGMLFCGDTLQVTMDRRRVSFMRSFPNAIPLPKKDLIIIRESLTGYAFSRAYGYSRGRNIICNARAAVDASIAAYLSINHREESAHD